MTCSNSATCTDRGVRGRLLAAALALCLAAGAAAGETGAPRSRRLLLIGIDGATWSVIDREIAAGRMPAFARLRAAGVAAPLKSLPGPFNASPVIWTSIATGCLPPEHGVLDFERATEQGPVLYTNADRRRPALWDIATSYGRRTDVVGWWPTWPADEILGTMISERSVAAPVENGQFPAAAAEVIRRAAAAVPEAVADREALAWLGPAIPPGRLTPAAAKDGAALEADLQSVYRADRLKLAEALDLMAAGRADAALVYFRGVDVLSHLAWRFTTTEGFARRRAPSAEETARYGALLARYYGFMDDCVAKLVAAAGDDATVIVVSDHGFRAMDIDPSFELEPLLRRLGFLETGPDGKPTSRSAVAGVTPPADVHAEERTVRFAPSVTKKTRRAIREALDETRYEDYRRLLAIRPSNDGRGLTIGPGEWVAELEESPEGGRLAGSYLVNDAPFPIDELERVEWSRSGWHDPLGIYLAAGRGVRAGAAAREPSVLDVAPTALRVLGLPVARDLPGRVLAETLDEAALPPAAAPVKSHAAVPLRHLGAPAEAPSEDRIREELRRLGYLR